MNYIPKYPYQMIVDRMVGSKVAREQRNYETLVGAVGAMQAVMGMSNVRRVQVLCVLRDVSKVGFAEART